MASGLSVYADVLRSLSNSFRLAPYPLHRGNRLRFSDKILDPAFRHDQVRISPAARRMVAQQGLPPLFENGVPAHDTMEPPPEENKYRTVMPRALHQANECPKAWEVFASLETSTLIISQPSGETVDSAPDGNLPESVADGSEETQAPSPKGRGLSARQGHHSASNHGIPHTVTPRAFERANENSNAREALSALVGRRPIVPPPSEAPPEVDSGDEGSGEDTVPPPGDGADNSDNGVPNPDETNEPQVTAPETLTETGESAPQPPLLISPSGSFVRVIDLRSVPVEESASDAVPNDSQNVTEQSQPEVIEPQPVSPQQEPLTSLASAPVSYSEPESAAESTESTEQPLVTVGPSGSFIQLVDMSS